MQNRYADVQTCVLKARRFVCYCGFADGEPPRREFQSKETHMELHELRNIVIELCEECDDYSVLEYIFQILAKDGYFEE